MEIEGSEPLIALSDIHLKENNEEAVDGENDESVLVELSTWNVVGVDSWGLQTGYKSVRDGLVYDKAWHETAKSLISDEVKESMVEKNRKSGDKIKSSEKRGIRYQRRRQGNACNCTPFSPVQLNLTHLPSISPLHR